MSWLAFISVSPSLDELFNGSSLFYHMMLINIALAFLAFSFAPVIVFHWFLRPRTSVFVPFHWFLTSSRPSGFILYLLPQCSEFRFTLFKSFTCRFWDVTTRVLTFVSENDSRISQHLKALAIPYHPHFFSAWKYRWARVQEVTNVGPGDIQIYYLIFVRKKRMRNFRTY